MLGAGAIVPSKLLQDPQVRTHAIHSNLLLINAEISDAVQLGHQNLENELRSRWA